MIKQVDKSEFGMELTKYKNIHIIHCYYALHFMALRISRNVTCFLTQLSPWLLSA